MDMKKTTSLLAGLMLVGITISSCAQESKQPATVAKNATVETIMARTSVRDFNSKAVSKATIDTLLRAGMAAPTAMNRQPWHFVVVQDKEKLAAIEQYPSPLAIVVCMDTEKTGEKNAKQWGSIDCSLASENILLAARSMGLGGVWTAAYPIEERMANVSKTLGLPDNIIPLNVLCLGYTDKMPAPKDKWKAVNVSYDTYGKR